MAALSEPRKLIKQVGKHRQNSKTHEYVVNGVTCKGAVMLLSRCFYGKNFQGFKSRRRGKTASSRDAGIRLHQHIFHKFACANELKKAGAIDVDANTPTSGTGGSVKKTSRKKKKVVAKKLKCSCKARFGKDVRKPQKDSDLDNLLKGFDAFLKKNQWKVIECEMVAGIVELGHATSIDVVCTENTKNPTSVFIVEVKTGYDRCLDTPRTQNNTGKMNGSCGKDIPNTFANHHQLQLWFGVEAFERTYDVRVSQAVVVYLKPSGKFKQIFGREWWFGSPTKRTQLYNQLRASKVY